MRNATRKVNVYKRLNVAAYLFFSFNVIFLNIFEHKDVAGDESEEVTNELGI